MKKKSFWTFDNPSNFERETFKGKTYKEWLVLYDKSAYAGTLTPKKERFFKIAIASARSGRQNLRTFMEYLARFMLVPLMVSLGVILKHLFFS